MVEYVSLRGAPCPQRSRCWHHAPLRPPRHRPAVCRRRRRCCLPGLHPGAPPPRVLRRCLPRGGFCAGRLARCQGSGREGSGICGPAVPGGCSGGEGGQGRRELSSTASQLACLLELARWFPGSTSKRCPSKGHAGALIEQERGAARRAGRWWAAAGGGSPSPEHPRRAVCHPQPLHARVQKVAAARLAACARGQTTWQSIRGSSFACLHCWQHHAYPVEREQATPAAHQGVRGLRAGTRGSRGAQPTWLGPPKHHPVELPMCGGMPHWRPLRPPMRGPAAPAAGTCGGGGEPMCVCGSWRSDRCCRCATPGACR